MTDSLAKARRDLWRASKKYRRLHGMVGRTVWAADSRWLAHRSIVGEPAAGRGDDGPEGHRRGAHLVHGRGIGSSLGVGALGAYVLVGQPNWPSKPERGVSDCSTVRCWFDGDTFEALRRCVVLPPSTSRGRCGSTRGVGPCRGGIRAATRWRCCTGCGSRSK